MGFLLPLGCIDMTISPQIKILFLVGTFSPCLSSGKVTNEPSLPFFVLHSAIVS